MGVVAGRRGAPGLGCGWPGMDLVFGADYLDRVIGLEVSLDTPLGLLHRCAEGLVQVRLDVVDVLQADAHPHVVVADSRGGQLFGRLLAMGRAGRVDHQGLGVADVGQVRSELDRFDKLPRSRVAAFHAESQNRAAAAGQIFLRHLVIRMRRQSRIVHPSHQGM